MKTKQNIAACLAIIFAATAAFGQKAEVAKIDTLVRSIDKAVKKYKSPELVFADVSDMEAKADDWQKFASEKVLDKHRETSETYSIAYCWRQNGKLAETNFTLFSPSGDWTKYVNSYYRPDGTLAKAAIDYRTFYGDLIVEQDLYFASSGAQIKKTTHVLDLQTHKPKKLTKDARENALAMAKEVDYYKTTSKLPFAKLLK